MLWGVLLFLHDPYGAKLIKPYYNAFNAALALFFMFIGTPTLIVSFAWVWWRDFQREVWSQRERRIFRTMTRVFWYTLLSYTAMMVYQLLGLGVAAGFIVCVAFIRQVLRLAKSETTQDENT